MTARDIRAYRAANPDARNVEIAAALGTTQGAVWAALRHGDRRGRPPGKMAAADARKARLVRRLELALADLRLTVDAAEREKDGERNE